MKTTGDDPLRIDEIQVGPGQLGLTICPGRNSNQPGWNYHRDLKADLDAIKAWGAETVLTLLEPHEMEIMGVSQLGAAVKDRGIRWLHLPIRDLEAPDAWGMESWKSLSPAVHRLLDAGGRLLIHCRGGLGRSGVMAALVLVERGEGLVSAMELVRRARPGAIETYNQESFLAAQADDSDERAYKIRASLLGGAIGDALGAEIEFWTLGRIRDEFPQTVDRLLMHDGRIGAITDDTQMTLFTAEGLVNARGHKSSLDTAKVTASVHEALLRWYCTQGGEPQIRTKIEGIVTDPRLQRRRAPGNTCLSALGAAIEPGSAARNDSKGCGTIMRVAPVAFMAGIGVIEVALSTSALTHGHPTGQKAAAAWAHILSGILSGTHPKSAARQAMQLFDGETSDAIERALVANRDGQPETVEHLGGGWVAEEALSIALYAALASKEFEEGLSIAVKHSGDSDSTGAIAGNLLGLLYPQEVMEHPWRRELECADLINGLAVEIARSAEAFGYA